MSVRDRLRRQSVALAQSLVLLRTGLHPDASADSPDPPTPYTPTDTSVVATESWASTGPLSPASASRSLTADDNSEDGLYGVQQSSSCGPSASSGEGSCTPGSSSAQSRSVSPEATPGTLTWTEASSQADSSPATSVAVSGPLESTPNELRTGPEASPWGLSTADNTLTESEAVTPSVAAGPSPSDGAHAAVCTPSVAKAAVSLAVPATAASAAGARPRLDSACAHGSPPPFQSLPPALPLETVGSCSAGSEVTTSHSPGRIKAAACGPTFGSPVPASPVATSSAQFSVSPATGSPAFGSPVPASPFATSSAEVAASPATPVPPVSPGVPAGSFGGRLSAATGAWTLWEGASEFDFDVPALPSGAHVALSLNCSMHHQMADAFSTPKTAFAKQ